MKISKDGITSKSQLPSGVVVKTTDTTKSGGYAEYTKDAFEDDGSLIAIFAPTEETLAAYKREVKIKWGSGEKFTTYSFDLSNATLDLELSKLSAGNRITKLKFNTNLSVAEVKGILENLSYEHIDAENNIILLRDDESNSRILVNRQPVLDGFEYVITIWTGWDDDNFVFVWSSMAVAEYGISQGWQNLTDNEFDISFRVGVINQPSTWKGILIGR